MQAGDLQRRPGVRRAMADVELDEFDPELDGREEASTGGSALATLINWVAGLVSLALVAGLFIWGYKLLMRDVTGVPVIQALEGPYRVAPEDPGGILAEHQGLSVNEVAGGGVAAPSPDQVILAPDAIELTDEDAVPGDLTDQPAGDVTVTPLDETQDDAHATDAAVTEALALADAVADGVAPLTPLADDVPGAPEQLALGGVVLRSPRPLERPVSDLSGAAREVTALSAPGAADIEVDAARVAAGTRLVQLGAYESEEVARREWDRISDQFIDFFEGKQRVVERAESGGKTFYRLRALGFLDLSDARRFCAALVAGHADCIPVVAR